MTDWQFFWRICIAFPRWRWNHRHRAPPLLVSSPANNNALIHLLDKQVFICGAEREKQTFRPVFCFVLFFFYFFYFCLAPLALVAKLVHRPVQWGIGLSICETVLLQTDTANSSLSLRNETWRWNSILNVHFNFQSLISVGLIFKLSCS